MLKKFIIIGVILVVVVFAAYLTLNFNLTGRFVSTSQSSPEEKIKTFYELVFPGTTADVVSFKEESGLYKVLVKIVSSTQTSYQEIYVSKDGKLLSTADSTILLENSINQIESQKNFVNCLYDKGVRIFGISNQTTQGGIATLLQLNVLGKIYSPKLFVSCDGILVQQCINVGITQVPSVIIGNTINPGVKTIDWFVTKTSCKL